MTLPELSVVVAGSRPMGVAPQLLDVLAAELASGQVELIVATTRDVVKVASTSARWVHCPLGSTVPELRLAGVRAASAPFVAVTEDFCVPAPGWAQTLLRARREQRAVAVGGPVARRSGNVAEWALTLIEYGRFFRATPEGPVNDLPSINIAYDRQRLLEVLPRDVTGLFEVDVHARLRADGGIFWRVPSALMFDTNEARVGRAALAQYHHGRLFGGGRVAGAGLPRRLKHAALSPLVPAVLLARIAREVAAARQTSQLVRALPALSVLLSAWSLGEAVGSLLGQGGSAARWT